jgi:hypothetical protein
MRRALMIPAVLAILAGCAGPGATTRVGQTAPPTNAPSTTTSQPVGTTAAACQPDTGPTGILSSLTVGHQGDRDRIVFQFHGSLAPAPRLTYVDRITQDPSDQPVPLLGDVFLSVTFHGARLDTAAIETDPSKVVRYDGPTRLTPRLPILQEVAVSGDFEAVLSFGLGLAEQAEIRTTTPAGQGCVILDLSRS